MDRRDLVALLYIILIGLVASGMAWLLYAVITSFIGGGQ